MKNKKLWIIVGSIVIIAVILIAINLTQKASQKEQVIKIGVILPLTGVNSVIGKEEKDGFEFAIKNFKSEKFKVEVLYEDCGSEAKNAVSIYQRLISQSKLIAIFASTSPIVNTLLPIVKENKNILFFPITTQKDVSSGDNIIRIWPSVKEEIRILNENIKKVIEDNTKIIISYPTTELGNDAYKLIKNEFADKIIMELPHPLTGVDFRNEVSKIRKIKNLKEVIFIAWTYPSQTLEILRAVDNYSLNFYKIFTSIGTDFPPVLEYLKNSKTKPFFVTTSFDIYSNSLEFKNLFKNHYNYYATWNVAAAYDCITFFLNAVDICLKNNNNVSVNCIKSAAKNLTIDGISGKISLGENNEASFPMSFVTVDNLGRIIEY